MKNILVPVDFSKYADHALYMAASIARIQNAEIHLVHTLGLGDALLPDDGVNAFDAAPFVMLTEKKFTDFINKPYLKGLKVSYSVRKTSVYKEISEVIKEVNADLIVMGSKGSSGLEEFFIGSNTQRVVRYSDVPVMVIKNKMEGFAIENAVFACDFKKENLLSYMKAFDFFKLLNIKMNLVYINTPDNFESSPKIRKRIKNFFKNMETPYKMKVNDVNVFSDYTVEKGIKDFCKVIKANFVGIPTHGYKGFSHFFSGSIGEDIVNHLKMPVVTFKI